MRSCSLTMIASLTVLCLCSFGQAAGDVNAMNPVGAWDTTVTPDPAREAPPFHAFHVYNFGGTTTNSNATCNAIAPSPTGLLCSDGYGVWKRIAGNRFVQTFYVQAHNQFGHFGFIKVRGVFTMEGKNRIAGHNEVFFILGTDIASPEDVIPLGVETFEGRRIVAELPSQ